MSMTNINIRMDNDIKNEFNAFCNNIGMSMSTAFNVFAKAALKERRIPFEIKDADPFYSEENQARLAKSLNEYKSGKLKSHELVGA